MGQSVGAMVDCRRQFALLPVRAGIALRSLPDRPEVPMLEIKTEYGPFHFGTSQNFAAKLAGQIGEHAKLLKARSVRTAGDE